MTRIEEMTITERLANITEWQANAEFPNPSVAWLLDYAKAAREVLGCGEVFQTCMRAGKRFCSDADCWRSTGADDRRGCPTFDQLIAERMGKAGE